jgi:phosphoribosylformylglycinamidine (FGAM) synthase-like amidotransferase family enzyme
MVTNNKTLNQYWTQLFQQGYQINYFILNGKKKNFFNKQTVKTVFGSIPIEEYYQDTKKAILKLTTHNGSPLEIHLIYTAAELKTRPRTIKEYIAAAKNKMK